MDSPLFVVMLGFVGLRRVNPDSARHVDVDGPHRTNLLWSHAGEALELNHRPNPGAYERFDRVHERIGDRLDRLRLPDSTPAFLESLDRFQAPMYLGRDHRLFNAPTEEPNNASGPFVDLVPAETSVDERLANGFEMKRPKVPSRERPEQLAEGSNREANVTDFGRWLAVFPVVTVSELQIGQRHGTGRESGVSFDREGGNSCLG
jgi:hypothetical protein